MLAERMIRRKLLGYAASFHVTRNVPIGAVDYECRSG